MAARPGDAGDAAQPSAGVGVTRTRPKAAARAPPDAKGSAPGVHPFVQKDSVRQRIMEAIKKAQLSVRSATKQATDEKKQPLDEHKLARQQVSAMLSELVTRMPSSKESAERMKETARRQQEWMDDELFDDMTRSAPTADSQRDLDAERKEAQRILEDVVQQGQLADAFEPFELAIEKFRDTGIWEPPVIEPPPAREKSDGKLRLPSFPVGVSILEVLPQDKRQLHLEVQRFIRHRYRTIVKQSPGLAPYARRQIEENLDEHMEEAILVMYGPRGLAEWRLFSDPIAALRSVPDLRVGPHLLLMELEARRDGVLLPSLPPILTRLVEEEEAKAAAKAREDAKTPMEAAEAKSSDLSAEEPDSEDERRRKTQAEQEEAQRRANEAAMRPDAPLSLEETPATIQVHSFSASP